MLAETTDVAYGKQREHERRCSVVLCCSRGSGGCESELPAAACRCRVEVRDQEYTRSGHGTTQSGMHSTRVSCTHDCIQRDQVDCEGATHVSRSTPTALVAIALSSECSGDAVCVCVRELRLGALLGQTLFGPGVTTSACLCRHQHSPLTPVPCGQQHCQQNKCCWGCRGTRLSPPPHHACLCVGSQVSLTSAHFDFLYFFIDFLF
jgi:hypothetical protein